MSNLKLIVNPTFLGLCLLCTIGCPSRPPATSNGSASTSDGPASNKKDSLESSQTRRTVPAADSESASSQTARSSQPEEAVLIQLEDRTIDSGMDYEHFSGRTGKNYIVETITCGLTTLDFDGDGLMDVYLPNGAPLNGTNVEPAPTNRLFRNEGNFRFRDVTQESGAGDLAFALGAAIGDLNNDGFPEIVVSNFGNVTLLTNHGDGTFYREEIKNQAAHQRIGAGLSFLDFDQDGNLDLFVSNYVIFDFESDVSRLVFGVPAAPGPKDYPPDCDLLLRNLGDGRFRDVSVSAGIAENTGAGMGTVAFDLDGDSDTDIFVCNDSAANFAYINQGDGTFVEDALLRGLAYGSDGASNASMGVDISDIDHDGFLDLVSTNFSEEIPNLYSNAGDGFFDDIGAACGLGVANRSVSWGIGLLDLDNDGWDDCFIAAGHLLEGVSKINDVDRFRAPHQVLRNENGKFTQKGVAGNALDAVQVSRGAAFEDFDNDGRIDALVINLNTGLQLIRNTTRNNNHFIDIRLIGTRGNRDAVGAKLRLSCDQLELVDEVIRGRGYQSHFESEVHFGLGTATQVDRLVIDWPNGATQEFSDLPADSTIVITEGSDEFNVSR